MKNLVLVKKYAQGLAQALESEEEFAAVLAGLRAFRDLLAGRADLRSALTSPFVPAEKRAAILAEVLRAAKTAPKAGRFLGLLLEHKRFDLLGEAIDALPETWNEHRGILTFEVSSVVPLSEAQKEKLRRELAALTKKPVTLVFKLDGGIVGGLSIRRGNIVYDASVEGNLEKVKEQIRQG